MDRRGAPVVVGGLGGGATATVDASGVVDAPEADLTLSWWVGADDEWRDPSEGRGSRQSLLGSAPVVETTVRVPSGDLVHRAYGVGGSGGVIVVELENRSPGPVAVALVLRPTAIRRKGELALVGDVVTVGGRPALLLPRVPQRWACGDDLSGGARAAVFEGRASDGPFVAPRSKRILEAAFLFPVPHRTTLRAALLLDPAAAATAGVTSLPAADDVRRGWAALLDRGMRTELPSPAQEGVDAARAALLLAAAGEPRPGVVAALEDWGFDAEAAAGWAALGTRARRSAARRAPSPATAWTRVSTYLAAASPAWAFPGGPAPFLTAVRDLLVVDAGERIELLPGFPESWLGADAVVHDAPTRAGRVSFGLRWHGARPALLWDAPDGVSLTAPALDPSWHAPGGAGEALLAAPGPGPLAPGPVTHPDGSAVDEPGGTA
jgi:hypothetical protein